MPLTFKERLEQRAAKNRAAFMGLYKLEIDKLHGLSKEEIDKITPDSTDMGPLSLYVLSHHTK